MRIVPFLISAAITVCLVVLLNMQLPIGGSKTPRLGAFLSPQVGFWQNAEAEYENYSIDIHSKQLQDRVDVYLDDRLVPHVFAQNEHDVFFVQGYLHARFRLWQMEFQTHAAAGRLAEVLGEKIGDKNVLELNDRRFRRLGMGIGAENALKEMEANPDSKMAFDAYRDGVNQYIDQLKPEDYPLEYKLLDYKPEHWTNLKTAYFLKYMSYELAGSEDDFEMTNAKNILTKTAFELAYPTSQDSLDPIVPKGTAFGKPGIVPKAPANADSIYFNYTKDSSIVKRETSVVSKARNSSDLSHVSRLTSYVLGLSFPEKPDKANGSNNWAVAGSKTASGKPILCGDPHLGLNLPSLWYEMQLHTPKWNVYGATFPGAPAIPIGFNDSIAWSETNAMRDVRDYYEITFKDATENEYQFNGGWNKTEWRYDTIKVRGKADFIDSIPITVFGPVMYENRYGNRQPKGKAYAVHWKAVDPSNDGWTFLKLARAKNYTDYLTAISTFSCPGQNFVFASKSGDIAIWNQGVFPAKWRRQGDFVMPGNDSSYMWQGMIPQNENPHVVNPMRGFVSSANQLPVDPTYPYYLGGSFPEYRGIEINKRLSVMNGITPKDMQQLQTDNFSIFAATAMPLLLRNLDTINPMTSEEKEYYDAIKTWNFRGDVDEKGPIILEKWWGCLMDTVYDDEFKAHKNVDVFFPYTTTLIESLLRDSTYRFIDNINTPQKETLRQMITAAWHKAAKQVGQLQRDRGYITWAKIKDSEVDHLLKIPALSRMHLNIGGGDNMINATKKQHGPSWRMIVSMTDTTEAYGVYPGGQNGNPGSKYYDSFIDTWAAGQYYKLWIMQPSEANDTRIRWRMTFSS